MARPRNPQVSSSLGVCVCVFVLQGKTDKRFLLSCCCYSWCLLLAADQYCLYTVKLYTGIFCPGRDFLLPMVAWSFGVNWASSQSLPALNFHISPSPAHLSFCMCVFVCVCKRQRTGCPPPLLSLPAFPASFCSPAILF